MLRLFDTARAQVVPFEAREPGRVSMYVCGPTVYGPPHLGHGRFSLVFDVLRRYLIWAGNDVTYVSNITDIDDKIIATAAAQGVPFEQVAQDNERIWYDAMDAIGVMRPTHDPHATDYVPQMVALIERLVEAERAYVTSDGVYFVAESVEDYGLLARQSIESLRAGARVAGNDEKRSPVDFALWKLAKPGEPSWPSPWGDGRPGWHTECVVMSLGLLGEGFDLHGGGLDLAFPHHENERAQAVADGKELAHFWVHNGFVEVDGEKMAKSVGNFTTLVDLISRTDARAYRLLVLRAHYRSPIEVSPVSIGDAESALERLDAFDRRVSGADLPAVLPDTTMMTRFVEAMDDDLNTPAVMALLFETVRAVNSSLDIEDIDRAAALAASAQEICRALGLPLGRGGKPLPADIVAKASARDAARDAKDFALADVLRHELTDAGYIVEDTATGTQVRRA